MRKLTARESVLIGAAFVALFGSLFYLNFLVPAMEEMKKLNAKIPYVERQLRAAQRIKAECDEINALIAAVQKKLDKREGNFQPRSFLDKLAKEVGLNREQLKGIKPPRSTIENDVYKEERFGVTLKKINIEDLIDYLYRIESSKYMLTVLTLRIDPLKREPKLLNASFDVTTFTRKKPKEEK